MLMDSIYKRDMYWTHSQSIVHFLIAVNTSVERCILSVALGGKFHFVIVSMDAC